MSYFCEDIDDKDVACCTTQMMILMMMRRRRRGVVLLQLKSRFLRKSRRAIAFQPLGKVEADDDFDDDADEDDYIGLPCQINDYLR